MKGAARFVFLERHAVFAKDTRNPPQVSKQVVVADSAMIVRKLKLHPRLVIGLTPASSCVFPSSPTARIPRTMEHGVDDNLHPADFKEYCVREPSEESPTHRTVDELVGFGMAANRRDARVDSS